MVQKFNIRRMILLNMITGGSALVGIIINSSLMKFYTDMVGLDPVAYGTVFFIFSIWNGANDILIAYWADRFPFHPIKGKYGRFIVWAIPVIGLSLFAIMNASPSWSQMVLAGYLLILLIIYEGAKALLDVSFGAFIVNTFLTTNMRAKNATIANYINFIPIFAGGMIPIWFLTGEFSRSTVVWIFTGCIAFGVILLIIGSRYVKENPDFYKNVQVAHGIKDIGRLLFDLITDKMVIIYVIGFSLIKIATGNYFTGYIYYMDNVLEVSGLKATIPDIITGAIQMATFPLIVIITKKYGLKKTYISGMMFAVLGHALLTLPIGYYAVSATYVLILFGYGFASVLLPVWGGVIVDHVELKTGKRQPALIGGLLSIVFVPAASIQPIIMSGMLSASGYDGSVKHQTQEVVNAIRMANGIIPAAICLAGLIIMMFIPVNFKQEKDIQSGMSDKHLQPQKA